MGDLFGLIRQGKFIDAHTKELLIINSEEVIRQIDDKFLSLKAQISVKEINELCSLFNQWWDRNKITNYIIDRLYDFYIGNIQVMIAERFDEAICSILDLFFHNSFIYNENIDRNVLFAELTYPIVDIKYEWGTFITNAANFYLQVLSDSHSFTDNVIILNKVLKENENQEYKDIALEVIDSIGSS